MHSTTDSADPLHAFRQKQRHHRLKILFVVLLAIGLFGVLPMPLGLGYFGWKLFRYDRVRLTLVNVSDDDISVSVGNAQAECQKRRVCSLEFRAGDVVLTATGSDGEVIEEIPFFTDNQPVFYNFDGARCYAVVDVSDFYTGASPTNPYRIVGRIYGEDRIYLLDGDHFVPPGGVLPNAAPGNNVMLWIDRASCLLLEEENEHLLVGQLHVRMQDRRERRRQQLEGSE